MSTLEVNTINPQSGTTITIGGSGDTVTLGSGATQSGFSGVNTPAFEAYLSSSQSGISKNVDVRINFNAERYDTANAFDTSTYKFTPQVAGKYYVYSKININGGAFSNMYVAFCSIKKNGSTIVRGSLDHRNNATGYMIHPSISGIVDMNGSTDYLEVYGYYDMGTGGTASYTGGADETFFGGFKLIE